MIRCRRAVEGLPLKLAVMALVMALAFPMLAEVSADFADDVLRQKCRRLAEMVRERAEDAVSSGTGNVRLVDMSTFAGGIRLCLGGTDTPDLVCVTSVTVSCEVRCVSPRVLFNGTLEAETGEWLLRLEATAPTGGHNLDMRRIS